MGKFLFLAIALFLDMLQGLVGLALFPIPVVGWSIGMVFSICITVIGGTVLTLGLGQAGFFRPGVMIPTFIVEMLPFLGFLPTWTGSTLYVITRKPKTKKPGLFKKFMMRGEKSSEAATPSSEGGRRPRGSASDSEEAPVETPREKEKVSPRSRSVDGIRTKEPPRREERAPANDNTPAAANDNGRAIIPQRPPRAAA